MKRRPDLFEARREIIIIRSIGIEAITIWLLPIQCGTYSGRKRGEGDTSTCKGPAERRRCLPDRTKDGVHAQIKIEVTPGVLAWGKRQLQRQAKMNRQKLRDHIK